MSENSENPQNLRDPPRPKGDLYQSPCRRAPYGHESIGFGAMDVTKPYEFTGFGAMDVTKPYEFIGFGAMDVSKPLP